MAEKRFTDKLYWSEFMTGVSLHRDGGRKANGSEDFGIGDSIEWV